MNINVIYPRKMCSLSVKRKSKSFFLHTGYTYRNGVFVHPEADSVFALKRGSIRIRIPDNDFSAQNFVKDYLNLIFGRETIGLSGLNEETSKVFNTVNYIAM